MIVNRCDAMNSLHFLFDLVGDPQRTDRSVQGCLAIGRSDLHGVSFHRLSVHGFAEKMLPHECLVNDGVSHDTLCHL